jgi:hypothetical protein
MFQKKYQIILTVILTAFLSIAATAQSQPVGSVKSDFDGDGKSDIGVFRNGEWWILKSSSQSGEYTYERFGQGGDNPVHADYDGDGKTDLAVYRCVGSQNMFFIRRSSDGQAVAQAWGNCPYDLPFRVIKDWDGDGKADITIFRQSPNAGEQAYFYILQSRDGRMRVIPWGLSQDTAYPGDFDGDGVMDAAVRRSSDNSFYVQRSSDHQMSVFRFGFTGLDNPLIGDFDGDRKADYAVYRFTTLTGWNDQGTWYVWNSSTQSLGGAKFGLDGSDWAVPADYDGDGKTDIAVWRRYEGNWFILKSTGGVAILNWGLQNDIPLTMP